MARSPFVLPIALRSTRRSRPRRGSLSPAGEIDAIVSLFDALSPYDRQIVPHLLKVEYPGISDLRCFAVSAKRYVLYRWRPGNRIQIVKASEAAWEPSLDGRKGNDGKPCASDLAFNPDEAPEGQFEAAAPRQTPR